MRLIDADALVSALNNSRLETQTGRAVPFNAVPFNAGVAFALAMVENAPTIDATPRWIPCSERSPEEYGCYLITTNDGRVDLALFGDTKDEKVWSSCDANGFYLLPLRGIEVIAWMPLPEPYEGERRNDE